MTRTPKTGYALPINDLLDYATREYQGGGHFPLATFRKVSAVLRSRNERKLKKLYLRLLDDLEPCRTVLQEQANAGIDFESPEMATVKSIVSDFLLEMDQRKLLFDQSFLKFFIDRGYFDVAREFIARVKTDDSRLMSEEIFQAMRNVWIMNSLQLCWGLPLELTPSIYAYSLLYPYTDNFLDDPEIGSHQKTAFNQRLSDVLSGEKRIPANVIEDRVFSLVGEIESQFDRDQFPGVFESLQLIQDAQIMSLRQDGGDPLASDDILPISLFKGGTSVLADAFLVKGNLDLKEMQFAFAYGSFLQLLDDFQDAETDRKDHHQTLFSIKNDSEPLDDEVIRLIAFILRANATDGSDTPIMSTMKEIIRACTLVMVMDAAGRNPRRISRRLYKELESRSKVSLSFYKEFEDRFKDLTGTDRSATVWRQS